MLDFDGAAFLSLVEQALQVMVIAGHCHNGVGEPFLWVQETTLPVCISAAEGERFADFGALHH